MGLADILKGASSKMPPKALGPMAEEETEEPMPDSEGSEDSAKSLALIAVRALKDDDEDAAADALVSLARACK